MNMTSERKDKIKSIAIVFLVIMLLLTLFSNTFLNRSLTEVSTQMITSDSLTTKVKGSGVVESADGYNVSIKETRKIKSVQVKTNATVEAGDVLFTLEDAESEELIAKRAEVATASQAYELAVLKAGITVDARNKIEAGQISSMNDKLNQKAAAVAAVNAAQAEVDKLTAASISSSNVDTKAEQNALNTAKQNELKAQETVSLAEDALATAKAEADSAKSLLDTYKSYKNGTVDYPAGGSINAGNVDTYIDSAQADYDEAVAKVNSKTAALTSAKQALVPYSQAVTNAQEALSNKTSSSNDSALKKAENTLAVAKTNLENLSAGMETEIALYYQYQALKLLQGDLAELEKNAVDAEITSPIAGTVTTVNFTAGMTVPAEETMMVIQPENMGMTLRFTISADQAKKIKVGDEAKVINNWYVDDAQGKVTQIRKSATDRNNCEVVCEMSGDDVRVGDTYTVSIGERKANYDLIVPTSSIREDSNGKFIYVIESKSTPLGNRYYARRADVEVIASDDNNSAIAATVDPWSYVITTTSKPIEANQQVRFDD